MNTRYVFGNPIETEAVLTKIEPSFFVDGEFLTLVPDHSVIDEADKGYLFTLTLEDKDIVYGLGESVRGINKRGHKYVSFNSDDPLHTEDKNSLYGAHNFILISSPTHNLGLFVDNPGRIVWDIGYRDLNKLYIYIESDSFEIDIYSGFDTPEETVRAFRKDIGPSYIPPKWAFGYAQSRWGYSSSSDIREIYANYKAADLPLDMIYVDIDYMDSYKDFTINRNTFEDFEKLVAEMKEAGVHLIPIIDGGVKIEKGYTL